MRILLIKTSSMGDVIHTLPALTDAGRAIPGISFDWVVESGFAEIPSWHPLVKNIIPVALRRWRKNIFAKQTRTEWQALRERLKDEPYDYILDAQGLLKSAVLTFLGKGLRTGLDWQSARESLASLAYQRKCRVNFYQHAIVRMRQLFSEALAYPLPASQPDFGINRVQFQTHPTHEKYIVLLHGTTWTSKQWPEAYWHQLINLATNAGYRIKVSGGNDEEVARAERFKQNNGQVDVFPRLSIGEMTQILANSAAAVAVDTGFGHLVAALNVPTVSIYGSTNAAYTGALGDSSLHLSADFACSPCLKRDCTFKPITDVAPACYQTISPMRVWGAITELLQKSA